MTDPNPAACRKLRRPSPTPSRDGPRQRGTRTNVRGAPSQVAPHRRRTKGECSAATSSRRRPRGDAGGEGSAPPPTPLPLAPQPAMRCGPQNRRAGTAAARRAHPCPGVRRRRVRLLARCGRYARPRSVQLAPRPARRRATRGQPVRGTDPQPVAGGHPPDPRRAGTRGAVASAARALRRRSTRRGRRRRPKTVTGGTSAARSVTRSRGESAKEGSSKWVGGCTRWGEGLSAQAIYDQLS